MGKFASLLGGLALAQPVLGAGAETLKFVTKHSMEIQASDSQGGSLHAGSVTAVVGLANDGCKNLPTANAELATKIKERFAGFNQLAAIPEKATTHLGLGKIVPVSCTKQGADINAGAASADQITLFFDLEWYAECFHATDCAAEAAAILAKLNLVDGENAFKHNFSPAELTSSVTAGVSTVWLKPTVYHMKRTSGNTGEVLAGSGVASPFGDLVIGAFSDATCTTAIADTSVTITTGEYETMSSTVSIAVAGNAGRFAGATFRADSDGIPRRTPGVIFTPDHSSKLGAGGTPAKLLVGACLYRGTALDKWIKVTYTDVGCRAKRSANANDATGAWMTFKSVINVCYTVTGGTSSDAVAKSADMAATKFGLAAATAYKAAGDLTTGLNAALTAAGATKAMASSAKVFHVVAGTAALATTAGDCDATTDVKHPMTVYWGAKNGSTGTPADNQAAIASAILATADSATFTLGIPVADTITVASADNKNKVASTVAWTTAPAARTTLLLPEYTITTYSDIMCTTGADTTKVENSFLHSAGSPTTCPAANANLVLTNAQQYSHKAVRNDVHEVALVKNACAAGVLTYASVATHELDVCLSAPLAGTYMKITVGATTNSLCYTAPAAASNAYVAAASLWALALAFVSMA